MRELVREIAEAGAEEAARRYLINDHGAAVGVQKRMMTQRVTVGILRAQANVLLNRLHFAHPGWQQAEERRERQEAAHAAQARAFAPGRYEGSTKARGTATSLVSREWAEAPIRRPPGAVEPGGGGGSGFERRWGSALGQ